MRGSCKKARMRRTLVTTLWDQWSCGTSCNDIKMERKTWFKKKSFWLAVSFEFKIHKKRCRSQLNLFRKQLKQFSEIQKQWHFQQFRAPYVRLFHRIDLCLRASMPTLLKGWRKSIRWIASFHSSHTFRIQAWICSLRVIIFLFSGLSDRHTKTNFSDFYWRHFIKNAKYLTHLKKGKISLPNRNLQ